MPAGPRCACPGIPGPGRADGVFGYSQGGGASAAAAELAAEYAQN